MMVSGMNEASSQMAKCAVYPRSKCSLHGNAIIVELVLSWIMVRVLRVTLSRSNGLLWVKVRILSNIIMLCRKEGEMMRVVVSGLAYA